VHTGRGLGHCQWALSGRPGPAPSPPGPRAPSRSGSGTAGRTPRGMAGPLAPPAAGFLKAFRRAGSGRSSGPPGRGDSGLICVRTSVGPGPPGQHARHAARVPLGSEPAY
jgi:hypothetical protein